MNKIKKSQKFSGTPFSQFALSDAVYNNAWDIVLVEIIRGADPEDKRPKGFGHSALHAAVQAGRLDIMEALIHLGADPNFSAPDGGGNIETPLHIAARNDKHEAVTLLIEKSAAIDPPDAYGYTPLMLAAYGGNAQVVKQLLEMGASPNKTNLDGEASLHAVVKGLGASVPERWHIEIIKTLLYHGADPNLESTQGESPTSIARSNTMQSIVRLLNSSISSQRKR